MSAQVYKHFYVDAVADGSFVVPIISGIVQPFNDSYYHGKLNDYMVGRHIGELDKLCKEKFYGTWLKNNECAKFSYDVSNLKFRLNNLEKMEDYLKRGGSFSNYNSPYTKKPDNPKQLREAIELAQAELSEFRNKINVIQQRIFDEHGFRFIYQKTT